MIGPTADVLEFLEWKLNECERLAVTKIRDQIQCYSKYAGNPAPQKPVTDRERFDEIVRMVKGAGIAVSRAQRSICDGELSAVARHVFENEQDRQRAIRDHRLCRKKSAKLFAILADRQCGKTTITAYIIAACMLCLERPLMFATRSKANRSDLVERVKVILKTEFGISGNVAWKSSPAIWRVEIQGGAPTDMLDGCLLYTSPSPRD